MIEKKQAFFENAQLMSEELALAPLAVLPEYQRKGVGRSLIREGHRIAKSLGYNYSVVLGNPNITQKRVIFLQVNTILNRRLT